VKQPVRSWNETSGNHLLGNMGSKELREWPGIMVSVDVHRLHQSSLQVSAPNEVLAQTTGVGYIRHKLVPRSEGRDMDIKIE